MDIVQLYSDFGISFMSEGHKHCRPGWVNTECPFCAGNPGLHLGYEVQNNRFRCWRCGWHPVDLTISKILKISQKEARDLIKTYEKYILSTPDPIVKIRRKAFKFPGNISNELLPNAKKYLEKRKFDPEYLQKIWDLKSTGPLSKLEHIDYQHRIIIPFHWDNEIVSFDSRDITGKAKERYKACPKERELIEHKQILYGLQQCWKETGIIVEGPTDVWRFGIYSCATSGIQFTPAQVRLIAKTFKRVAVCFDDDPQAVIQADLLVFELKARNVDAFRVNIKGDPGAMIQSEANYLIEQLL